MFRTEEPKCELPHTAFSVFGEPRKVFDCYRPPAAQQRFWEILPDERYVSNPAKGSRHTKGTAVDLTIVDKNGAELEMPSVFDDFTERAHRKDIAEEEM